MNPFNNKWLALLVVGAVLFIVSEVAGTDGVLSQAVGSNAAAAGEAPLPPGVVQVAAADTVDAGEVPEEDLPQVFIPNSPEIEDAEDQSMEGEEGEPEEIDPDAVEDPDFVEEEEVSDE